MPQDVRQVLGLLVEHVGKFTENPDCTMLTMKQFGKPRL